LASSPTDLPIHHFAAQDGQQLVYREVGTGRPLVLIHGLFSNAWVNWIKYGHAGRLAEAGFRVIMPDLRGHGDSAAPHDPAAYPPDVLARDGEALLRHLNLSDYDLGGYSLGGRTAMRMLVAGAAPRRAIVAGMGLRGMLDTGLRADFFQEVLTNLGNHPRGSGAYMSEAFLRSTGGDPLAMLPLLNSFVDTTEAELNSIDLPVLVLCGVDDEDNGSAAELAGHLSSGRLSQIPGNHMTAVLQPQLSSEMAAFLQDA
jgi:pimeloyl-ACP methyl ester carboxylesterase